jgi:cystathionine gamma-lyase
MRFATLAIHAGQEPDPTTGALMTPVYLNSTYIQEAPGRHRGYDYARTNHPTRAALERNLAELEGGKFGIAFASGMAAESAALSLLKSGDHVVSCQDLYGGTYRLMTRVFGRFDIETTFVDATRIEAVAQAMGPRTRMLFLESPSNPLLTVCDIRALSDLARSRGVKVVVDNTFATPWFQKPLALGADIVVHSTTKYLGGHSDVVGGALVTSDEALSAELKFLQNAVGAVPGGLDCFLVLRGIKTLPVRMRTHGENAMKIASFLSTHREVARVHYPGLPDSPYHAIAIKQMSGFGGMVSFELLGGPPRNTRFASSTRLFALAESLGGVESLVCQPLTMTHASIPADQRKKGGLPDALVRLSVGLEDVDDLIEDLERAISVSKG